MHILSVSKGVLLLCLLGTGFSAVAGTNGFFVPYFRGSAGSEAGYWETFTVPVGAPGNRPDRAGSTLDAVLEQSDPNAVLTGSGNIYNLNNRSVFTLEDSTPFTVATVVLQVRTLGSELDYSSISLTYTNESGQHSLAPLPRVELNRGSQPGLGATVSSFWQWDLSGVPLTSYSISFQASGVSLSLDAVTLDTSSQFSPLFTPPFSLSDTTPTIERWMYAHNAAPCDRPAGSTFGTFGDEAGVDTRHAQHLVGWDTAAVATTNRGGARYLVRSCRLTLTINRGNLFAHDPTHDGYRTYLGTNDPSYLADSDPGRPMELFGVGFRNGYNVATFDQCAPFGANTPSQRNAYAVGYSTNGTLVDVSNNVGKTNELYPAFEVAPFAIGQTTNAAAGQLVPPGAKVTFDLNLNDPFVLAHVQNALNDGRLRFMLSSLHVTGGQFGAATYPDFATHFNDAILSPTRLEIQGVVVSDGDVDSDGLPDDWELFFLGTLTHNGSSDTDGDRSPNRAELQAGTDPSQASSRLYIAAITYEPAKAIIRFPHAANRRYTVQHSENLGIWTALTNPPVFDLATGMVSWMDTTPAQNKRVYRVLAD